MVIQLSFNMSKRILMPWEWRVWSLEMIRCSEEWRSLSELPEVDRIPVILACSMVWPVELKCAATGLPGRLDLIDLRWSEKRVDKFLVSPIYSIWQHWQTMALIKFLEVHVNEEVMWWRIPLEPVISTVWRTCAHVLHLGRLHSVVPGGDWGSHARSN